MRLPSPLALKSLVEKTLLYLGDITVRAAFLAYRTAVLIVAIAKGLVILALAGLILASPFVLLAWALSWIPGLAGLAPPNWMLVLAPLPLVAAVVWLMAPAQAPERAAPRVYAGVIGRVDSRIDRLIAWIGRLKFFRTPLVFVIDPGSHKVKGHEVRHLLQTVRRGDILLRGYEGYVDGLFIRWAGTRDPKAGHFSHAALYAGELGEEHYRVAARRLQSLDEEGRPVEATPQAIDRVRNDTEFFSRGPDRVLHAMTQGVFTEDLLTFARCDYLAVLRIAPEAIRLNDEERRYFRRNQLISDEALQGEQRALHDRLIRGDTVPRQEAIEAAIRSGLGKIGSGYDFQFNEGKTGSRFSCSEFVYYCYKGLHTYLGLLPQPHSLMGLFRRDTVSPGDLWLNSQTGDRLNVVWQSASLDLGHRESDLPAGAGAGTRDA